MAYAVDISEVGPPEYPLLETLRQTVFCEFGHVSRTSIAESFKDRVDLLIHIAHLEGNPIGFAAGYRRTPEIYYVNYLALLRDFRGEGYGRRLLMLQEDFARARGYRYVQFNTFNHFPGMIRLGLSRGYSPVGVEQRESTGGDLAIKFEKRLLESQAPIAAATAAEQMEELRLSSSDVLQLRKALDDGYAVLGLVHHSGDAAPVMILGRSIQSERS